MVLARKRMRLEREEGRAEVKAELEPVIRELRERIRLLENGGADAKPATDSAA